MNQKAISEDRELAISTSELKNFIMILIMEHNKM